MHTPDKDLDADALTERIDAAISEGIRRGRDQAARRRVRVRRRIASAAAACLLLFACLLSIRVSPVFAAMVRDIPGFEKFVDLIEGTQDKGIQLAMDNDFAVPIGVSDERDGTRFTVQGILADETRLVLFYEIQAPGDWEDIQLDRPEAEDANTGEHLMASIGYSFTATEKDNSGRAVRRGTVDINLSREAKLPDRVTFRLELHGNTDAASQVIGRPPEQRAGTEDPAALLAASRQRGTALAVTFPIDHARFADMRHEYAIDRTIEVEGQRVTFEKAVVSPLSVALEVSYDGSNTKQIFGPGDIRLVDDKGTAWSNHLSSLAKDHPVFYFESPYFNEPRSLAIDGSWFRALDKSKMAVTVDTDTGRILNAPDDKLVLSAVNRLGDYTRLDFALRGLDPMDNMMYAPLEPEFEDAAGRRYKTADLQEVTSGYKEGDAPQHALYYLDNKDADQFRQPLTFTLSQYPDYIRQEYRIPIK